MRISKARLFLELAFGGTAGSLLVAGEYAWAVVALMLTGIVLLDPRRLIARYKTRSYAGLATVAPTHPLDPNEVMDPREGARNIQVALKGLRKALRASPSVQLMLASGFRLIGTEKYKGWLFDELELTKPALEVLLLDYESPICAARGGTVLNRSSKGTNHSGNSYAVGIQAVLWTLRNWQKIHGMEVEVRLYQQEPIWQMLIFPKELWLLVSADGRSTDTSPVFVFKRGQKFGLSWGWEAVWRRRWSDADTRLVDLDTVIEPDWNLVVDARPHP